MMAPIDLTALRRKAGGLARADRLAEAAACLSAGLAEAPDDVPILRQLAAVQARQGRLAAADATLAQAFALDKANPALTRQYARVKVRAGDGEAAIALLIRGLSLDPGAIDGLMLLATCLATRGDFAAATAVAEAALALNRSTAAALELAARLAARHGRMDRAAGHFSALEGLARSPYGAALNRGLAAHCRGDNDAADHCFRSAAALITPALAGNYRLSLGDCVRFSRSFYETIRDAPAPDDDGVVHVSAPARGRDILYVSVDQVYFTRYRAQIANNARQLNRAGLHLHVIDAADTDGLADFASSIGASLSIERPGLTEQAKSFSATYYASIRMIRALQLTRRHGLGRIAVADVDGTWQPGVDAMFDLLDGHDLVHVDIGSFYPWTTINASLAVYGPSSHDYLDLVGRYVAHFISEGTARWRLDQCALSCCLHFMRHFAGRPIRARNIRQHTGRFIRFEAKAAG